LQKTLLIPYKRHYEVDSSLFGSICPTDFVQIKHKVVFSEPFEHTLLIIFVRIKWSGISGLRLSWLV